MRFAKFWKMQVFDLSLTERMFYRDAIRTLQAWEPLKDEFVELDLIRKMLEAEIPAFTELTRRRGGGDLQRSIQRGRRLSTALSE